MKKIILILTLVMMGGIGIVSAQTTNSTTKGKPMWEPNKAICDPIKAEKEAESQMKPAVKSVYDMEKKSRGKEQNLSEAALNVYCNPPVKSSESKTNSNKSNNSSSQQKGTAQSAR